MRSLPFTGLEWSFNMIDMGFNEKGERYIDEEQAMKKTR